MSANEEQFYRETCDYDTITVDSLESGLTGGSFVNINIDSELEDHSALLSVTLRGNVNGTALRGGKFRDECLNFMIFVGELELDGGDLEELPTNVDKLCKSVGKHATVQRDFEHDSNGGGPYSCCIQHNSSMIESSLLACGNNCEAVEHILFSCALPPASEQLDLIQDILGEEERSIYVKALMHEAPWVAAPDLVSFTYREDLSLVQQLQKRRLAWMGLLAAIVGLASTASSKLSKFSSKHAFPLLVFYQLS